MLNLLKTIATSWGYLCLVIRLNFQLVIFLCNSRIQLNNEVGAPLVSVKMVYSSFYGSKIILFSWFFSFFGRGTQSFSYITLSLVVMDNYKEFNSKSKVTSFAVLTRVKTFLLIICQLSIKMFVITLFKRKYCIYSFLPFLVSSILQVCIFLFFSQLLL